MANEFFFLSFLEEFGVWDFRIRVACWSFERFMGRRSEGCWDWVLSSVAVSFNPKISRPSCLGGLGVGEIGLPVGGKAILALEWFLGF
jgi:hypothetical protein